MAAFGMAHAVGYYPRQPPGPHAMNDATIPIGLRHSMTFLVDASLTVPAIACAFEAIGAGFHERAVIDAARFLARVEARAQPA